MRNVEPPRCAAHSGLVGAPPGNKNRLTHGAYVVVPIHSIADLVADLQRKVGRLSAMIDDCMDATQVAGLFALHAQMASRLGRLLRDQRALDGKAADSMLDAIGVVLDEISTEMGIKL
jgi:hypothetical protein